MQTQNMKASQVHSILPIRVADYRLKGIEKFVADEASVRDIEQLGIAIPRELIQPLVGVYDAIYANVTASTIPTFIQFLQTWLPGFIRVVTAARKADQICPLSIVGDWENEQIVQGMDELVGTPALYSDYTNSPIVSWNTTFDYRTIVRWDLAMKSGVLSDARAAKININDSALKRQAIAQAFEILRNTIAFLGYNGGANRTYGILNEPQLPTYVNFPLNAGSTSRTWALKTYLEICRDVDLMVQALITSSADLIDPIGADGQGIKTTLVLGSNVITTLSTQNVQGTKSVRQYLKETYPNMRIVSCPEFNLAYSSANAAYLFAEEYTGDGSTDGGQAWMQMVPQKVRLVGTAPTTKGFKEAYSNALAGIFVKRSWMFVRYYGN